MTLGLAALALTERAEGRGSVTVPRSAPVVRPMTDARPGLPSLLAVRAAADAMPRGMPGGAVLLPGSGNDPERVLRTAHRRSAPDLTRASPNPCSGRWASEARKPILDVMCSKSLARGARRI